MGLLGDEFGKMVCCVAARGNATGEIADVGVDGGGSGRLICEGRGKKTLSLFDTFEGLPTTDRLDSRFAAGQYAASVDSVQSYLARFPNVQVHKGFFPATSVPIADKRFSFVHLDVDLYQPTHDALEFFYPRVNQGGIFLIHDYLWAEGVRAAVQGFFSRRQEPILELAGTYGGIAQLSSQSVNTSDPTEPQ